MNIFKYDFGYAWIWNYGHLIPIIIFTVIGLLAWKFKWSRWIKGVSIFIVLWAAVALVIVQYILCFNLPPKLPTNKFLTGGSGNVLDAGAGSGRSALMVLLGRPESHVVAMDFYKGYYGIPDNTPERLLANARLAGVQDRVEVKVGDIREIPLANNSLDAAVSVAVIDHMGPEGIKKSLAEIRRVLRPRGEFLLMVINNDVWIRFTYPFLVHHGYFGPKTSAAIWTGYLTGAGFNIVEQGTKPVTLYFLVSK